MKQALERAVACAVDGAMCGTMNVSNGVIGRIFARLKSCNAISRYVRPSRARSSTGHRPSPAKMRTEIGSIGTRRCVSGFPENDRSRVRFQVGSRGPSGPTILLVARLDERERFGYLRLARWLNERGWNTVFPHLPFHYSRRPRGYLNGELAITANLGSQQAKHSGKA